MRTVILFLLVLTSAISCQKESDNGLNQVNNSHRIQRKVIYNDNVEIGISSFDYEGERLIRYSTNYNSGDGYRHEFLYQNNTIYVSESSNSQSFSSGEWIENEREEFIMDEMGNINEIQGYTNNKGSWELSMKTSFQYKNHNLVSWQFYNVTENSEFELVQKGEYDYANNKLVEYRLFEVSYPESYESKVVYIYSGDNLKKIEGLYLENGQWKESDTEINYFYTGDKISSISFRYLDSETQKWNTGVIEYIYDNNGYLIEEIQNSGERSYLYEYEEGNGNAGLLLYFIESHFFGGLITPRLKSTSVNDLSVSNLNSLGNFNSHGIFSIKNAPM